MTTLIPSESTRRTTTPIERTFETFDGLELFYRAWLPSRPTHKALLLIHRGHEHSGRWQGFVEDLNLSDLAVFAYDARGHGRSPGDRGYAVGFADHVRDLDAFARHVCARYDVPIENVVALGHSVGGVTLASWVHDYAPQIRGMILGTPALRIKLYVPFARAGLRLLQTIKGKAFIKSYVKPSMLTHDPAAVAAYAADPLISRQIAVNVLLDLHQTSSRVIDDAAAIRTPALVLAAGADWVVKNSAIRQFYDRLGSRAKSLHVLGGFSHAIFHERDRAYPVSLARDFIKHLFRDPPPKRSLIRADETGYTRQEFDRLSRKAPALSPKRIGFAAQRLALASVGRLSEGIRKGWEHGFDSGQSLDHVYRNTARGITPLGRIIDRIYLNSLGWRGIRIRGQHLRLLLQRAIAETLERQSRARIVDIASGPGRYLLETLQELKAVPVSALLRDRDEEALGRARAIALRNHQTNVEFAAGDAFDFDSLAALRPRPDIAVVSGLFELVGDNQKVLSSLRGLAEAMGQQGGHLLYTNQPWHPQIEMIARVLTRRDGSVWVMRRRTQEEMDELVRAAGFEKVDMLIDRWGIFTVSLARRI